MATARKKKKKTTPRRPANPRPAATATRQSRAPRPWAALLADIGLMRYVLLSASLITVLFVPPPGTKAVYEGWALWQTTLLPTLAPNFLMLQLLDALMSRVFMIDRKGDERRRYRLIVWLNLGMAALLVIAWTPFFLAIGK
jgi:hypothetical protein